MITIPLGEAVGLVTHQTKKGVEHVPRPLPGEWRRVIPQTWGDVFWLQGLDNQNEKYAPAHGDGILVKERIIRNRGMQ